MIEAISNIFHTPLTFSKEDKAYKTHFTLAIYDEKLDDNYLEFLSKSEKERYENFKFHGRKKSFLIGRAIAKFSIQKLFNKDPKSFSIVTGIFSHPVVEGVDNNIQVSIAHTNISCAALAHHEEFPVGVDIEKIKESNVDVIMKILTPDEKKFVEADEINAFLLWTAKESLGKVLRTGILIPLNLLEIKTIKKQGGIYHIGFKNFGQYNAFAFRFENSFVCVCYPSVSEISPSDLEKIEKISGE